MRFSSVSLTMILGMSVGCQTFHDQWDKLTTPPHNPEKHADHEVKSVKEKPLSEAKSPQASTDAGKGVTVAEARKAMAKSPLIEEQKPSMDSNLDRSEILAQVGQRLADSSRSSGIKFEVATLRNSRANIDTTSTGKVWVTEGMLRELATEDEMASVLALRMAEVLYDKGSDSGGSRMSAPLPGDPPGVLPADMQASLQGDKGKPRKPADRLADREVDKLAEEILARAGFQHASAAKARAKFEQIQLANKTNHSLNEVKKTLAN